MANLIKLQEQIPLGGLSRYRGIMVMNAAGKLAVNVNGNILPARYVDPVVVSLGDAVVVDIVSGETGQSEAVVTGRLTASPRPGRAKVKTVPAGSVTITVTGTDGVDYVADFVGSYTPAVGNEVLLAWNAAMPTVTGKVVPTAAPETGPPPIQPPPGPSESGRGDYRCVDASTYSAVGGWESVIPARVGRVFQGLIPGSATRAYGSWFYGGSPKELAGRTIDRVRILLPRRLAGVGNFNAPVTIIFQCHIHDRRPGGAVSLVGSPFSLTIPAGWAGDAVDLPTHFAPFLLSGGGVSIIGPDYAGFSSRTEDPSTGQIFLDWRR
ncbi:hypothetical protein [Arthrobacter sp. GMC3]|uniref:hypothetical protein n=1 Tax=Arthrobacter sp. GMC3 TaxID=2058894 RepID=UPI000CE473D5|nr:hypothetical protein [Arthrobacter sp. GMC3]